MISPEPGSILPLEPRFDLPFQAISEIKRQSLHLLKHHIDYCFSRSLYYRRQLERIPFEIGRFDSLEDLRHLPITDKSMLEAHPDDFLCVSRDKIVDACQTSGTTGMPITMLQTSRDLTRLGYNEELAFRQTGMTRADRVLIGCAMGRCFMAGLAYFEGIRKIGAMAVRVGTSYVPLLCEAVKLHRPTMILGVPSQVVKLAEALAASGLNPASMGVRSLLAIGEPIRRQDLSLSPLGERLQGLWGGQVFSTYASTEMATSICDCSAGKGGHLPPDLVVVEILDDEDRPCKQGDPGEVVVTPLQVEGMPLIRFRTGDIAAFVEGKCPCGRRTPRLGPILGRKNQMLKVQGTTLFPGVITGILDEISEIDNYYLEIFEDYSLSDRVVVTVSRIAGARITEDDIAGQIKAKSRVRVEVVLASQSVVSTKVINPEKRKPIRFFDYRRINKPIENDSHG